MGGGNEAEAEEYAGAQLIKSGMPMMRRRG